MIPMTLFAESFDWNNLTQQAVNGLTIGSLFALIALGYTMVYGIVELINFAHGDLFMLGAFLAWTILSWFGLDKSEALKAASTFTLLAPLVLAFLVVPVFCAALNYSVDRTVYKPLRNAPKLAPLVSAIGVSFVFMGVGLFWGGPQDVNFPDVIGALERKAVGEEPPTSAADKTGSDDAKKEKPKSRNLLGPNSKVELTVKHVLILGVTIPLMIALTWFVKLTNLGKAMRATAQNPTAAKLMGINTDKVIGATFAIGGMLAGFGSIVYGLTINTISYQMGFQNGLYAFTAAVLGGIGNIPGAVLGGLVIGLVRSLGSAYVGETWTSALVFVVLIVILVFRPSGLLGARIREKV
ncbi:MAG TPA: branched-chain amino acid ABC transporter permease [Fimbriiglobus sp.]|jgi:branched-chain amino acid transport system permease protein